MTSTILRTGGALLLLAAPAFTPALAQEAPAPVENEAPAASEDPATVEEAFDAPAAPVDTAPAATYTDAQIAAFVTATRAINALPAEDQTAKQQQALAIVAEAGIDVATYNAIGQALPTDEALAERVRLALAATQSTSGA